jgi:hypothetical protein
MVDGHDDSDSQCAQRPVFGRIALSAAAGRGPVHPPLAGVGRGGLPVPPGQG